jgi:C4-dicarboxylate transporter DctQ subunit
MSSSVKWQPAGPVGRAVHAIEETMIALLLGLMVLVTFINVVLRYVFNDSLIWGLEVVLILFAWLVMFGVAYAFKITAHLGVDALTNVMAPGPRRIAAIVSALICVAYAVLLLKGAWDYWAPFAGLDATTGRWFPTGFANSRDQAWYETEQVPIPFLHGWLEQTFNMGEEYEKLPRFIPYAMLPFAVALTLFRIGQALMRIVRGTQESMIVSHEAEEALEEAAKRQDETAPDAPSPVRGA